MNFNQIIKENDSKQLVNFDTRFLEIKSNWEKENIKPNVLMHTCCAPCSTVVLEQIAKLCNLTIFFSNSNIHPIEEYQLRSLSQKKFIDDFNNTHSLNVKFIEDTYQPKTFIENVYKEHLELENEGGKRCNYCYEMRLDRAALYAKEHCYDYFGSALTLSPHKNSQTINQIGYDVQAIYSVSYLPSDFKKRNGFKRSIEISKQYDIYRQCYCGCVFSAKQHGIDLKAVRCQAIDQIQDILKNS